MIQSAINILKNVPEERFFFFAKGFLLILIHSNNCFELFVKLKKPFPVFKKMRISLGCNWK